MMNFLPPSLKSAWDLKSIFDRRLIGLAAALLVGGVVAMWPSTAELLLFCAAILSLGLVYLTLKQPLWGLGVVLLIAPLGAWEARTGIPGFPLASGQLLLFLLFALWVGRFLLLRRTTLPYFPLFPFVAGFILLMSLTMLNTVDMSLSSKELLKWVELGFIIILVLDAVDLSSAKESNRWLTVLLALILLPAVVQAMIGLIQFLQPQGPDSFLILGRFYRAFGTFEQPNPYGGFMVLHTLLVSGLGLGLVIRLWKQWRRDGSLGGRTLLLIMVLGGLLALFLLSVVASWSRGAWLALAAGGGVMLVSWPGRWRNRLAMLLGLIVLLWGGWQTNLLPSSVTSRITSAADFEVRDLRDIELTNANFALVERLAFWQAAGNMFRQNLWFGVGFGAYDAAYSDFSPEGWPKSLGHAHNYYLNLLAEVGLVGLIAYLVLWGAILGQAWWLIGNAPDRWRGIALGLFGAWIALTTHHLVDKLYVNNIYLQVGALLALQQLLVNLVRSTRPPAFQSVPSNPIQK